MKKVLFERLHAIHFDTVVRGKACRVHPGQVYACNVLLDMGLIKFKQGGGGPIYWIEVSLTPLGQERLKVEEAQRALEEVDKPAVNDWPVAPKRAAGP